jgi:SGNH domain (fused to AT3 domains)
VRAHWRGLVVVGMLGAILLGAILIVVLSATENPADTVSASRSSAALPAATAPVAAVQGVAKETASPIATGSGLAIPTVVSPPAEAAANCARPIATSVISSAGLSPAIPVADVLCLVAAAPAITTLPVDLVPPLEQADADYGIPTALRQCVAIDGIAEVPACVFGDPAGSRTVIVFGDSHAFSWLPAFDQIGKRLHWKVILLAKSACTPAYVSTYNLTKKAPFPDCDRWHDYAIARINQTHPDMVVVITHALAPNAQSVALSNAEWVEAMSKTLSSITIPNARKVVFANLPVPRFGNPPNLFGGPECLAAHLSDVQACSALSEFAVDARSQLRAQAVAMQSGTHSIDISRWLCSQQVCTAVIGKMNVYVHDGHLSATYATYVSGALQTELQPIMDSP